MKSVSLVHWTSSPFDVKGGGGLEVIEKVILLRLGNVYRVRLYAAKLTEKSSATYTKLPHISRLGKFDPIYLTYVCLNTRKSVAIAFNYPLIALARSKKTIIYFHNFIKFRGKNVFLPLYPLLKSRYSKITMMFCSNYLKQQFIHQYPEFPQRKIIVIPNSIDVKEIQYRKSGFHSPVRLVFLGQWSIEKGLDDLLLACDELYNSGLNFELHLIGSFSLWNNRKNDNVNININKRYIKFSAKLSHEEVMAYLGRMDIMVIPSRWNEPFGIVGLEGMAKGSIVVSSGKGGLGDYIVHNKTGFIYGGGGVGLAELLKKVINLDSKKINEIRNNCYKMINEKYSLNRYVSSIREVVRRLG